MTQKRRKIGISNTRDPGETNGAMYDPMAGARRSIEVGKRLACLGALGTAVSVPAGSTVYCFNEDSAVHWVATGPAAVAAPTTSANGIPVPPAGYFAVAVGLDEFIRSDSAKVFGYLQYDESVLVEEGAE